MPKTLPLPKTVLLWGPQRERDMTRNKLTSSVWFCIQAHQPNSNVTLNCPVFHKTTHPKIQRGEGISPSPPAALLPTHTAAAASHVGELGGFIKSEGKPGAAAVPDWKGRFHSGEGSRLPFHVPLRWKDIEQPRSNRILRSTTPMLYILKSRRIQDQTAPS